VHAVEPSVTGQGVAATGRDAGQSAAFAVSGPASTTVPSPLELEPQPTNTAVASTTTIAAARAVGITA
jgi:hypothetical protein